MTRTREENAADLEFEEKTRPLTREEIAAKFNTEVYDTNEMTALFTVHHFMAPWVSVTRKADGKKGSLEFQHMPRFYYSFVPND